MSIEIIKATQELKIKEAKSQAFFSLSRLSRIMAKKKKVNKKLNDSLIKQHKIENRIMMMMISKPNPNKSFDQMKSGSTCEILRDYKLNHMKRKPTLLPLTSIKRLYET
ncbi:CLUMA_CG013953, isoform A [Clunio marinus]|uniref:CLUMA_CG013953, isoform A n=1 Tax=Clunio marinus TaxID=568069 RepID=A0A1J1INM3_9DIPT|nr:CLUMA_CG013953, isoform A [Clunio marinus]